MNGYFILEEAAASKLSLGREGYWGSSLPHQAALPTVPGWGVGGGSWACCDRKWTPGDGVGGTHIGPLQLLPSSRNLWTLSGQERHYLLPVGPC